MDISKLCLVVVERQKDFAQTNFMLLCSTLGLEFPSVIPDMPSNYDLTTIAAGTWAHL